MESLSVDALFTVNLVDGQPQVTLSEEPTVEMGDLDSDFEGAIVGTVFDLVFEAFEETLSDSLSGAVADFMTSEVDTMLSGFLGGIALDALGQSVQVPGIGEGEPVNEPAPTTADGAEGEGMPSSEPAPTTAEPAPTTARNKGDTFDPGTTQEGGERLYYSSREAFEFYAGVVTVTAESKELVVTWDVRPWLRLVLSEPLGIPATELDIGSTGGPSVGFRGATKSFKLVTR